jgi:xylan 1,4-beta-xylosidase
MHDEPYAAAFVIKTIMEANSLVQGYSYWTFSDIFEENYFPSVPFHGGFGLLNIHDIAKPVYGSGWPDASFNYG